MSKIFNTSADCKPKLHYMVDISEKISEIKELVDRGEYFTINRARQYGKTTILRALGRTLEESYVVISLDFQVMSYANFENEQTFVSAFSSELLDNVKAIPEEINEKLIAFADGTAGNITLFTLFRVLSKWCGLSKLPVVLIIDEVDSAANNQVFLDFLAQLRGYYINRDVKPTFQSVILAGVYDIKNMKRKLRPGEEHKANSPWNIAADFEVVMSFSAEEIAGMLQEYENDHHTGMDIKEISGLIYDYTSGYPFLVSRLCKVIDEKVAGSGQFPDKADAWKREGFLEAVRIVLGEKNTLFDSLANKLSDYPELREMIYALLFYGKEIPYNSLNKPIEIAEMFGFIKNENNKAVISNRIFETVLYNLFLSEEVVGNRIYDSALQNKNQFIKDGKLDMKLVLEKFVEAFDYLYGDQNEKFIEDVGRRYFMLFLKPIINGTGNCYVEARTRKMNRTDIVVDYRGEQFVVELKLWRGKKYHADGEKQISEYLDFYHLKKGYMLTFCFNKKKEIGVKEVWYGDKLLIEAVV
ncbi:MAG: AAA-like domain-containing protein [Eubacteriales bacterium]|nr:AAA-like domain-containing protein [Eubacteriales bacterium]